MNNIHLNKFTPEHQAFHDTHIGHFSVITQKNDSPFYQVLLLVFSSFKVYMTDFLFAR